MPVNLEAKKIITAKGFEKDQEALLIATKTKDSARHALWLRLKDFIGMLYGKFEGGQAYFHL